MAAGTSQNVVNEALALIGYDGFPVSGPAPNFDNSVPGKIAQAVYPYAVAAVARINSWSFPRTVATLAATGNAAPFPWSVEYGFPAGCIDVWQIASPSDGPNNPIPRSWARGVATVSLVQSSVIWTNLSPAVAIYNSNPLESAWDQLFWETVVTYLAARFALADLGKPDLGAFYIEQWRQMIPLAAERTDS